VIRQPNGQPRRGHFTENLVKPHVLDEDLFAAYAQMACDEARESEAEAWSDALITDVSEAR
jgi:hypothetical protein